MNRFVSVMKAVVDYIHRVHAINLMNEAKDVNDELFPELRQFNQ